eukprot:g7411.t1
MLNTLQQTAPPPVDKNWALYWSFYLFGFGALTPWSALVSSVDYFEDVYPDWNSIRWASLAYFIPAVIACILQIWKPALCQGEKYIGIGFISFTVILILLPTLDWALVGDGKGTALSFGLLMSFSVVIGLMAALVEGGLIGVTLVLPEQYPQTYVAGVGCSGIFIALIRVFTKAAFTESRNGLRTSAFVFFFISAFICLLCILVRYIIVLKHPVLVYYKNIKSAEIEDEMILIPNSTSGENQGSVVLKKLKFPFIILVVIYSVTLGIYPGITEDVDCDALGDWYSVILVVVMVLFDFIGRSFPLSLVCLRQDWIRNATNWRIVLIPLVALVYKYFSNPFSIGVLLAILGITNGYLSLAIFGVGHGMMRGYKESLIGGCVLLLALFVGLLIGAILSLIWAALD